MCSYWENKKGGWGQRGDRYLVIRLNSGDVGFRVHDRLWLGRGGVGRKGGGEGGMLKAM